MQPGALGKEESLLEEGACHLCQKGQVAMASWKGKGAQALGVLGGTVPLAVPGCDLPLEAEVELSHSCRALLSFIHFGVSLCICLMSGHLARPQVTLQGLWLLFSA